jgi:CheY-like chemotaxis protein
VTVHLAASREQGGHSVVTCSVRDTGVGISPEALPRLFDAFSQEDESTTRRFGGSGLGLTICKRLVTLMDGILDVTTSTRGSTFSLTVAFEVVESAQVDRELAGRRLLLVESRPLVAESVAQLLRERGAEVLLASTAPEGRPLAPRAEVVLVSSQLPAGDGVQLARALHLEGKVVGLLTPLSSPAELASGVDFLLPLPVRRNQLLSQVRRVLRLPEPASVRAIKQLHATFAARVLVAEDNPVNQRVVQGLLAKLGCEVVVVGNGAAAVRAAQASPFDLILMDCQMPELDGFDATHRIRAAEKTRTPIVALTAGAMMGDRERCLATGMDDYLSKPLRLEDLERVLTRFLHPTGGQLP